MGEVMTGLVEDHVAQASAQDDADHGVKEQVVELNPGDRRQTLCDTPSPQPPGADEPDQIHEAIPAHGEGSELEDDRINLRVGQHRDRRLARKALRVYDELAAGCPRDDAARSTAPREPEVEFRVRVGNLAVHDAAP